MMRRIEWNRARPRSDFFGGFPGVFPYPIGVDFSAGLGAALKIEMRRNVRV
jgi:hypothetical protein